MLHFSLVSFNLQKKKKEKERWIFIPSELKSEWLPFELKWTFWQKFVSIEMRKTITITMPICIGKKSNLLLTKNLKKKNRIECNFSLLSQSINWLFLFFFSFYPFRWTWTKFHFCSFFCSSNLLFFLLFCVNFFLFTRLRVCVI